MDLSLIDVGGPCKITDGTAVIYTEGNVQLTAQPTWRDIPSSIATDDAALVDLVWKVSFTPKSIWTPAIRGALLPTTYTNFTAAGGRIIGAANRTVTILGADGEQYVLTRAKVTKMPSLFLGLGKSLYGDVEYTAFIGHGKALTDADAFYAQSTGVTWSQTDYPTTHVESLCTAAWGAVTGWATVYAEEGFQLNHDLKMEPVKQGNITVDYRVQAYKASVAFKPQGPTSAQLLTAFGAQGSGLGIGTRRSARANDLVITGTGIVVTAKSVGVAQGKMNFDSKMNRHDEWVLETSLATPGDRLTLA